MVSVHSNETPTKTASLWLLFVFKIVSAGLKLMILLPRHVNGLALHHTWPLIHSSTFTVTAKFPGCQKGLTALPLVCAARLAWRVQKGRKAQVWGGKGLQGPWATFPLRASFSGLEGLAVCERSNLSKCLFSTSAAALSYSSSCCGDPQP